MKPIALVLVLLAAACTPEPPGKFLPPPPCPGDGPRSTVSAAHVRDLAKVSCSAGEAWAKCFRALEQSEDERAEARRVAEVARFVCVESEAWDTCAGRIIAIRDEEGPGQPLRPPPPKPCELAGLICP